MSDAYWKVTDGMIQPASLPPVPSKRPRSEHDVPSGQEMPGHQSHNDVQGVQHAVRDVDPIEASYERFLQSGQTASYAGSESVERSMGNGVTGQPIDGLHVMGTVGSEPFAAKRRNLGFGGVRPEVHLPPEASSTLFVEGLPANCTRREVSHIFRQFPGYKEVRLVIKESRRPGGNQFVLCFVDFVSPTHAATAMDTLQVIERELEFLKGKRRFAEGTVYSFDMLLSFHGLMNSSANLMGYKFDQYDRDSANLRLQFARRPGGRSGGGHHRNY